MTHTVAATSNPLAPTETQRASAARSTGTPFAQVQAAAVKASDAKDKTTSADDAKSSASVPKGEKTQKIAGHNYVEIVSGPRNGMFINNTGSRRDGEAFLIVKRNGREFHVYGTGKERSVYEVGRERAATPAAGTTGTTGTDGATGTSGTGASGTTTTGTTTSGSTGASTTPATGTTSAT
ncbi:MAG: hypothetical protein QOH72_3827 [Solirubrobacteraceae bacterium]|jgi:hypothetical protein|nr:hypothetical protein [Solirubrobacteraceae bacterium]